MSSAFVGRALATITEALLLLIEAPNLVADCRILNHHIGASSAKSLAITKTAVSSDNLARSVLVPTPT